MQLQEMKGAIILLAVVALIGTATAIALDAFRSDIAGDMSLTTVVNESVTYTNNTFTALANNARAVLTCIEVRNGSANADIISPSNYTCTEGAGINVLLTDASGEIDTNVNVSYSYSDGDEGYNVSNAGLTGIQNTTGYLGTIGTIIGVAVLIGIVILAFTFVRR